MTVTTVVRCSRLSGNLVRGRVGRWKSRNAVKGTRLSRGIKHETPPLSRCVAHYRTEQPLGKRMDFASLSARSGREPPPPKCTSLLLQHATLFKWRPRTQQLSRQRSHGSMVRPVRNREHASTVVGQDQRPMPLCRRAHQTQPSVAGISFLFGICFPAHFNRNTGIIESSTLPRSFLFLSQGLN